MACHDAQGPPTGMQWDSPPSEPFPIMFLLLNTWSGSAYSGCTLPPAPTRVPDGSTASEPEMRAAMQTLKRYDTDVNNYVKCLAFEAQQLRLTREEQARRHNVAIEALQSAADRFNAQMRVFMAR